MSILAVASSAKAQVTSDGTLSTEVTSSDNQNFTIEAGDRTGNNLFHSFSEFSVPTNGSAVFNNASTIENIFGRITGNNSSNIDGLIQANGTANVFLLNPNGIVFGESASLNIGGSFMATTAEKILFSDTTEFSAVDTALAPLLTISAPVGLGLGENPGPVTVTGRGHNLEIDPPNTSTPIRDNRPVGLQVGPGHTLALIGGNILVDGGNLTANQGRVELGSVAQSGTVALSPTTDGFTFDYGTLERFSDIRFTGAASVDVSGEGSGNLHFQSGNLAVIEGAAIISNVLGAEDGGEVRVRVSDTVEIRGQQNIPFPSSFFNQGELNSTGQVGELIFEVGTLRISDMALIDSSIFGQGSGGPLAIRANDIELNGGDSFDSFYSFAAILADARPGSEGNTASIDIQSNTLRLEEAGIFSGTGEGDGDRINLQVNTLLATDEALIVTATFGQGKAASINIAGNLEPQAEALRLEGGSQIISNTFASASGDGGSLSIQANDIELSGANPSTGSFSGILVDAVSEGAAGSLELQAETLRVEGGARITSNTFASGDGGSLSIRANDIELSGVNPFDEFSSGIFAEAVSEGHGGRLELQAETLRVEGGARIASNTFASGDGGRLSIRANDIELSGVNPFDGFSSGIFAEAVSEGNAGRLELQTETLRVEGGARIASNTFALGDGGRLSIQANDIELSGVNPFNRFLSPSGIFAGALSEGDTGRLELQAETLRVEGGAQIASDTEGSGRGGDINIQVQKLQLGDNASISSIAQGLDGDGGSIDITARSQLTVGDDSAITVNSEGGSSAGDIEASSDFIFLNNGRITAQTNSGDGGDITLQAEDILLLRNGSEISSTAGTAMAGGNGGDIDIDTGFVLAIPEEDSDITANAFNGRGGNISLNAQGVFGLEFRDNLTPLSDITASSNFGQAGLVDIDTSEATPDADSIELPTDLEDASARIGQSLCAGEGNSFTASGRGGLSSSPYETLTGGVTWEDWYISEQVTGERRASAEIPVEESPVIENERVVEAQGWGTDASGNVVLTTAPTSVIAQDGFVDGFASCQTVREALSMKRE